MTAVSGYGFHFERTGRGPIQGPNDSSGEHFSGMPLAESLVRELIQNSIDARLNDDTTVEVEFEVKLLSPTEIPGYEQLVHAAREVVRDTRNLQGGEAMQKALRSLESDRVPVLRVGDYGTKGLKGSESVECPHDPLSALTRGTGISSTESSRGGSFGIGSSVGFVASKMKTVAYVTRAVDKPHEVIFASMCRFASHKDEDGQWRDGSGVYTLLEAKDFSYLRNPDPIGTFPTRSEMGTDLYIFDFADAFEDLDLAEIRRAVVRNFMVALHRNRLVVRGQGVGEGWQLDAQTMRTLLEEDDDLRSNWMPFYQALTENEPITGNLKTVGSVQLYVHVDPAMPKSLHTQMMRKPLMRVGWYRPRFPIPYAALFICEDEHGNELLRNIEPPAHNKWQSTGPRSNGQAVREIQKFIRTQLEDVLPTQTGAQTTIEGLEQYVPLLDTQGDTFEPRFLGTTPRGERPDERESPVRLGRRDEYDAALKEEPAEFEVEVMNRGVSSEAGEHEGFRGDPSGGTTDTDSDQKRVSTKATEGDGKTLIPRRSIRLRSWQAAGSNHTIVVINALRDVSGDLPLVALTSTGGQAMPLPIEDVWVEENGRRTSLTWTGATIRGLTIEKGRAVRLGLTFAGGSRFRIGVQHG